MGIRVHTRGVEASNAALADHAPLRIEALDRDVVRPCRPMDARTRSALGELQQPWIENEFPSRLGHVLKRALARWTLTPREHAELAAGDLAHDAPIALIVDHELAVAEKREVVVEKPLQKRDLGALLCVDRGPGGVHVVDERFDSCAHRPKVPYSGTDISKRLAKIRFKGVELFHVKAVDLRVYHDLRPLCAALKIRDAP